MRIAVCLFVAIAFGSALAEDVCPQGCIKPPAKLTCEQLLTKAKQRNCVLPKETAAVPVAAPCTHSPCPPAQVTVNCPECKPQIVDRVSIVETTPKQHGKALFGGGALYNAGWGATIVGGYQWGNGWQLIGGPNYIKHDDYNGSATNCTPDTDLYSTSHCGCATLPYSVPGRDPWGGTIMVIKAF